MYCLGGLIFVEYGVGYFKREYFLKMINKDNIYVMKLIKKVFDFKNLLNFGKVF